jgi:hypothetical protein
MRDVLSFFARVMSVGLRRHVNYAPGDIIPLPAEHRLPGMNSPMAALEARDPGI